MSIKVDSSKIERRRGEALTLSPGEVCIVQAGKERRMKLSYVGCEHGKFVVFRMPASREMVSLFTPDSMVAVRFQQGGLLCAFTTSVVGVATRPFGLLFLNYPKFFEVLRLRSHDRVECFVPTTIYADGEEVPGFLRNVSLGGCKLIINDAVTAPAGVDLKKEIFLAFSLPTAEETVYTPGIVRRSVIVDGKLDVGVEFKHLIPDVEEALSEYVHALKSHHLE